MKNLIIILLAFISYNSGAQCNASFNYSYIDCDSIWFTPASTGPQYVYFWDFGNGNTSMSPSPTTAYTSNGVYTVILTLQDTVAGCFQSQTQVVTINCAASCSLNAVFTLNQDPNTCNTYFVSSISGGTAPYTYFWNFGDGQTSTQANPIHQYPNQSVFTPCVTITDATGCDTTICSVITSQCSPTSCDAQFTTSFVTCDSLFFYPVSTGPQYTYNWDFGDGTFSTSPNPTHQYAANGTYMVVCYIMNTITTCQDAITIPVTINCAFSPCTTQGAISWNQNPNSCEIQFVSTAFGGTYPYSYYWTFGDGQTSNSPNPTHQYPTIGSWTPCLTITDANGCDTTICTVITSTCVQSSCNAFFNPALVNCNTVTVYPSSTGPQYTYLWDFGDGNFSSVQNPTHTYSSDGVYIITLTLTDSLSGCSDYQVYTILINCGTQCTVDGDFIYTVNAGNCEVAFASTAFGGQAPYSYYWNFGDGQSSNQPNPTHQYPNNSVYTPCLTITDANGCDTTICYPIQINCSPTSCDAQFTTSFVTCDSLFFYPVSTGPQYTYNWDFGDGTFSTSPNPTHQYAANGTYMVVCYIMNTITSCQDAVTIPVTINCAFSPCTTQGAFAWNVDTITCNVNFVSTAFGGTAPYTYFWNFGDGQTSNLANPSHAYPNNSAWTPCLTITDANGCDTTICDVVQVNCTPTPCNALFTASYITCNTLGFYPVATGSQFTYFWNFGDGSTSTLPSPTHQYSADGVYVVTMNILDQVAGCQDIYTFSVPVNCGTSCTVNGVLTYNLNPNNCNVSFASSVWGGQAPYSYYWNFGDGTSSNQANPTHQYPNNSTFTPCLTITDANGCDTTICTVVAVTCISTSCNASFNYVYTACDSVLFTPLNNNVQYNYLWDFGDGSFSSDMSPVHGFSNGVYTVVLYLTDSLSGCSNAFTASITVNCNATCDINGAFTWFTDSSLCDINFVSTAFGGQAPYTYYWSFGDGTSATEPHPTHTYPPNSVWTPCLTITDVNGCDTTICMPIQSSCTLGTETLEIENNLLIYPNPTNGQFTVEITTASNIEIYDLGGKLIYFDTCEGACENYKVDLSDVENGTYIIRVQTEKSIISKRIVKN